MGRVIHTTDYVLTDEGRVRELVRTHGWATLVSVTDDGPVASHVPVLLDDEVVLPSAARAGAAPGGSASPAARPGRAAEPASAARPGPAAGPAPAARPGHAARGLPDRFTVPTAPLTVLGHLGRPDELLHEIGSGREHLLLVQGPSGYVSPGWYGYAPAVPTWNYLAVHLYGTVELLDPDDSYAVLGATVDRYEAPTW